MDLAELEAGRLELRPSAADPLDAIRAVVARHEPAARAKGVSVRVEVAGAVPALILDERRVAQVLDQLVDNAVRYTPAGEVVVRVEASTPDPDPDLADLTVTVTDTGIGILPEARDRVFAAFVSALDTEQRDHDRAALGIPVSAGLIDLMGGTLDYTSRPGSGSSFWFSIRVPLAPAASPAASTTTRTPAPEERPGVLLAEDDEINRTVARTILERLGLDVAIAVDGTEALAEAEARPYAAILMDWQMPGRSGLDVARAIRAGDGPNRTTPILAITAAAMSGDRERCLEAGMDDFLAKPFTMAQLAEALGTLGLPVGRPDAAAASATAPVLDESRVDELRSIAGADGLSLYEELRSLFVATAPGLLGELHAALGRDDLAHVARQARELGGACAALGAVRCAATAERVEQACAEDDRRRLQRLVPRLERHLDETITTL